MAASVLIAGAGPVGLCAALALADAGVRVRVFEAAADVEEDLRASTFHPPTLDLLDRYGVTAELLARGLVCPHWQIRLHPSGERAVFDLAVLDGETRHPYRLQCEQWKLSRALLSRVTAAPQAEVAFGAEVTAFAQDADGVTVTVERAGRAETLRGSFLIGADGARSTVRRLLGLEFDGQTYPETTLLATTTFPFEEHLDGLSNVSYCWKDGGNFSLLKVPGRWRVSIYPREDMSIEEQISEANIEAALQEIVRRDVRYEVLERRPYRVHQRIVSCYRHGRVVLAGDAAHLNSPAGGMGMNGGVHDALNLADKLARIVRGEDARLLDLYDRQRRPVAREQILAQADRNRARMREKDPAKRRAMLADMQALAADRDRLKAHLLKTSMIEGLRLAEQVA
ncbi:MAG: FAD-dependent monooxygenase [Burkholderiales bacterium]|nr:FAD-dependent monooxygenase [Burkholderiales bacterium]